PCGQPMVIRHNTRARALIGYGCNTPGCRKTHRAQDYLDGYVIGHVLELLGDHSFLAELAAPADDGAAAEIAELEARKAAAEQQLAAWSTIRTSTRRCSPSPSRVSPSGSPSGAGRSPPRRGRGCCWSTPGWTSRRGRACRWGRGGRWCAPPTPSRCGR